jgi:hypothetical protein
VTYALQRVGSLAWVFAPAAGRRGAAGGGLTARPAVCQHVCGSQAGRGRVRGPRWSGRSLVCAAGGRGGGYNRRPRCVQARARRASARGGPRAGDNRSRQLPPAHAKSGQGCGCCKARRSQRSLRIQANVSMCRTPSGGVRQRAGAVRAPAHPGAPSPPQQPHRRPLVESEAPRAGRWCPCTLSRNHRRMRRHCRSPRR